jgi:predicted nuclease of predicted toxin-antitoxin system
MNLLADESCAGPVVRALRKAGHDVTAIAEIAKGATDEEVLDRALNEKRVLITEPGLWQIGVRARAFHGRRDSCEISQ